MAGVIAIVLKSVVLVLYSVDALSGVSVSLFMGPMGAVMIGVLPEIGSEVLAGLNANAFVVVVTALKMSGLGLGLAFETSGRSAAFDCRPRALLDCARVLQTWMPSYHV